MNPPCLKLQNLCRTFETPQGPRNVLTGLNLDVYSGDRIVLFGPSGCGKTTLLHLMAFLDSPSRGDIFFQGHLTREWDETKRCDLRAKEIGMVFQQFHLLPHHSVLDNVLLRMRYLPQDAEIPVPAQHLLEEMGLGDRASQSARLLSGGEKQRLCIARAMLLQPSLFLADEPTGNLDAENADRIRSLFTNVSTRGAATVIATHDERWFDFATRVFRFDQGQIVEESP